MASKAMRLKRSRRDLWLLRGVALAISFLLWITVFGGKRSEAVKRVALDYILPKGLVITNQPPHEVSYRVQGPRAFLKDFEERAITIPVDLSSKRAGEYEVQLNEEMLGVPLGLKVTSLSQESIPIRLEKVGVRRVPVRAVFAGQLPEGMKVSNVTLKPSTVEVRAALSRLGAIDSVPTEALTLSPTSLRQEFDGKLSLTDWPGATAELPLVHLTVEIDGALTRRWLREIPVGVRVGSGAGARFLDTQKLGVTVTPPTVNFLIEGTPGVVENFKSSELEVWAEIPRAKTGEYRARLDWRLPPEVRVLRRSTDDASVSVP